MAIKCPEFHPSLGWFIIIPGINGKDLLQQIMSPWDYYQSMGVNPLTSNLDSPNGQFYEAITLPSQIVPSIHMSSLLGQAFPPESVSMSEVVLSNYVGLPYITMNAPGTSSPLYNNFNPVVSAEIQFEQIPYNSLMSSSINPTSSPVVESFSMYPSSLMPGSLPVLSLADDSAKSMISDFKSLPMNSTSPMLFKVDTLPFKSTNKNFVQSNIAAYEQGLSTSTKSSNYKELMLPSTSSFSSTSQKSKINNLVLSTMDVKPIPSTAFKFPSSSSQSNSSIVNKSTSSTTK